MNSELIGVVGLGLLGRGIAACFLVHGFRVVAYSKQRDDYDRARESVHQAIQEHVEAGVQQKSLLSEWQRRYLEAGSMKEFRDCNFVVESVVEDIAVKQRVFDEIEQTVAEHIPIASNTSAIPITMLQANRRNAERFLGMHWAEPASVTRFMELIPGDKTSDATLATAIDLAKRIDKDPCLVRQDVPGFIANRLAYAMYREALHLLQIGVGDVDTIDRSFQNACGLWASMCGPFRWIDITGGGALYGRSMQRVLPTLCNSTDLPEFLEKMMEREARGVVDGQGFYSYAEGDAQRWDACLHHQAWAIRKVQDGSAHPPTTSEDGD